jgi:hypothetical protein
LLARNAVGTPGSEGSHPVNSHIAARHGNALARGRDDIGIEIAEDFRERRKCVDRANIIKNAIRTRFVPSICPAQRASRPRDSDLSPYVVQVKLGSAVCNSDVALGGRFLS